MRGADPARTAGPGGAAGRLAAQLPVICIARRLPSSAPGVEVVRTADDDGAGLAVDDLVALGHRDIVHIDGGRAPGSADRRAVTAPPCAATA